MYKHFTLVLFVLLSLISRAQTMVFKMTLFGDSIGTSIVSRMHDQSGDSFILDSNVKAKVLFISRQNKTHYEARYKGGKLISAIYYEINNGKKDRWSTVHFDGQLYQVDSYHGRKSFAEAPTFSIGPIYWENIDPSRKRFYYEPEAEYSEVKYTDAHTLEYKGSDGNKNVFHFSNGQIADAEFHTTLATVYIRRVK